MKLEERYQLVWQIIQEIKAGTRTHNQEYYHSTTNPEDTNPYSCNTAHCIAGWIVVEIHKYLDLPLDFLCQTEEDYGVYILDFDVNNKTYYFENILSKLTEENLTLNSFVIGEWKFCEKFLQLTTARSLSLFEPELTIEEIKQNFLEIAKSKGINVY